MKKGNGKVIIGVVVAVFLLLVGVAVAKFAFSEMPPLAKKTPVKIKQTVTQKKRTAIKHKEVNIDGMKMTVSGEISEEQISQIKSKLPKNLNGKASISVIVTDKNGKSAQLTPEEQVAMAKAIHDQLKKAIEKMPPKVHEKLRQGLNSPEGKKALHDSVMTYNKQLTGEERKAADPAFQAVLKTLNDVKTEKKPTTDKNN